MSIPANGLGHPYRYFVLLLGAFSLLGASGCATVLSEKRYPVTIENAKAPTYFSVHDRKNRVIHQGVTPQQVTLDAKAFPFWPAKYSVTFAGQQAASQTKEVKASVDPWVAGNLLLGGVPGTLVDGATGAMFRLPKSVQGDVPPQFAVTDPNIGSTIARSSSRSLDGSGSPRRDQNIMMASGPTESRNGDVVNSSETVRTATATSDDIIPGSLMR